MNESSNFFKAIQALPGKKVRFYTGGGDRGFIQGPVMKVEGDMIYVEKEGEIRGTVHTLTISALAVRYYEIDRLVDTD